MPPKKRKKRRGHRPRQPKPLLLRQLKAKYGFKFAHGVKYAIESVDVTPKSRVVVIGGHNYSDFVNALSHTASQTTPHVYSHIVPQGEVVDDDSDDLEHILSIIKEHKPDVIMFAFKMGEWPARRQLYEVSRKVNPRRLFATMPGITMDAVREILPAETAVMEERTINLSKFLERSRGEEMLIRTIGKHREYFLKAMIPKAKKYHIHCDVPTPGTVFNIPSGETFFSPGRMHGEIYFSSGSIVGDMGVVKEGVRAKFVDNELHGVEWLSLHDKHIVNRLLQKLDSMDTFSCSELGIGTHPSITFENAGVNPLLIEKVVDTLHLGFGTPRATNLGNVRSSKFFDIIIPRSLVKIGSEAIIETLGRS